MGERTGVGWTGKTWNPWRGCKKISPGCAHCYMFTGQLRYGRDPNIVVRSKTTFNDPLKWLEPSLIFTCSWSDWFIEQADQWRGEAYDIMRATADRHTYQVLTKRSDRLRFLGVPDDLPHVWWGVSVEDRKYGMPRIAQLRDYTPGNRFLSIEPLLENVGILDLRGISWGIVGGESGPGFREMPYDAFAEVVLQFDAAGVPLFVKQDSGPLPGRQGRIPDRLFRHEMPTAFARYAA